MSRAEVSLTLLLAGGLAIVCGIATAGGGNPHIDSTMVTGGCMACHEGHGEPGSPMMETDQKELCLSCHSTRSRMDQQITAGNLAAAAEPALLATVLSSPYAHPVDRRGFSRREAGQTVCTSCHSPHRSMPPGRTLSQETGLKKPSPRDPARFEFELCEECHGSSGVTTQSLTDISRLTSPSNPSYHPVEAPIAGSSPSIIAALRGREINCTDCHGNDDADGPRGPHGSNIVYMLRDPYTTVDGSEEGTQAYGLCYRCHTRDVVLKDPQFPYHASHVIDEGASCATCHNPHGSIDNRALIRFGEETHIAGVSPSPQSGRLEFVSDGPGSGACFLSCHGVDHNPMAYGAMKLRLEMLGKDSIRSLSPGRDRLRRPQQPLSPVSGGSMTRDE